jgi:hypothetical protein
MQKQKTSDYSRAKEDDILYYESYEEPKPIIIHNLKIWKTKK